MLKKCDICGREIASEAPVCPYCGATLQQRERAADGQTILILVGLILVVLLNTYNYVTETFNTIDRTTNVWCGYVNSGKLEIYKDDIAKKGSSICLKGSSWRSSESVHLPPVFTLNGKTVYDTDYDKEMIIVKGEITGDYYKEIYPQEISIWDK